MKLFEYMSLLGCCKYLSSGDALEAADEEAWVCPGWTPGSTLHGLCLRPTDFNGGLWTCFIAMEGDRRGGFEPSMEIWQWKDKALIQRCWHAAHSYQAHCE